MCVNIFAPWPNWAQSANFGHIHKRRGSNGHTGISGIGPALQHPSELAACHFHAAACLAATEVPGAHGHARPAFFQAGNGNVNVPGFQDQTPHPSGNAPCQWQQKRALKLAVSLVLMAVLAPLCSPCDTPQLLYGVREGSDMRRRMLQMNQAFYGSAC